jgi:hypothetical protein
MALQPGHLDPNQFTEHLIQPHRTKCEPALDCAGAWRRPFGTFNTKTIATIGESSGAAKFAARDSLQFTMAYSGDTFSLCQKS